ncbi:hypothetical protein HRR95_004981 [Exophiala dermatitidis]|nr:hypothetical protein HRR95_004981 [Exophiala dermatitidis]
MDQLKGALNSFTGGDQEQKQQVPGEQTQQGSSSGGGFLGGLGDKLNSAAGGGKESEKNEDYLDKGKAVLISSKRSSLDKDHKIMRVPSNKPRTNRSVTLSGANPNADKSATGKDFPVKDKETKF